MKLFTIFFSKSKSNAIRLTSFDLNFKHDSGYPSRMLMFAPIKWMLYYISSFQTFLFSLRFYFKIVIILKEIHVDVETDFTIYLNDFRATYKPNYQHHAEILHISISGSNWWTNVLLSDRQLPKEVDEQKGSTQKRHQTIQGWPLKKWKGEGRT